MSVKRGFGFVIIFLLVPAFVSAFGFDPAPYINGISSLNDSCDFQHSLVIYESGGDTLDWMHYNQEGGDLDDFTSKFFNDYYNPQIGQSLLYSNNRGCRANFQVKTKTNGNYFYTSYIYVYDAPINLTFQNCGYNEDRAEPVYSHGNFLVLKPDFSLENPFSQDNLENSISGYTYGKNDRKSNDGGGWDCDPAGEDDEYKPQDIELQEDGLYIVVVGSSCNGKGSGRFGHTSYEGCRQRVGVDGNYIFDDPGLDGDLNGDPVDPLPIFGDGYFFSNKLMGFNDGVSFGSQYSLGSFFADGDINDFTCYLYTGIHSNAFNQSLPAQHRCCGDDDTPIGTFLGDEDLSCTSSGWSDNPRVIGDTCSAGGDGNYIGDYESSLDSVWDSTTAYDGCCGDDPFYRALRAQNTLGFTTATTSFCEIGTDCVNTTERVDTGTVESWLKVATFEDIPTDLCQGIMYSCHNVNGGNPSWQASGETCDSTSFSSSCTYQASCNLDGQTYFAPITDDNNPANPLYQNGNEACTRGPSNGICIKFSEQFGYIFGSIIPCQEAEGDKHFFNSNNNYFCSNDYNSTLDDPKIDSNPPAEWHWWDATQDAFTIHTIGG